jgi:hypothetical protein
MALSKAEASAGRLDAIWIKYAKITILALLCAIGRVAQTMEFVLHSRVPRPSSAWAGFFHG